MNASLLASLDDEINKIFKVGNIVLKMVQFSLPYFETNTFLFIKPICSCDSYDTNLTDNNG